MNRHQRREEKHQIEKQLLEILERLKHQNQLFLQEKEEASEIRHQLEIRKVVFDDLYQRFLQALEKARNLNCTIPSNEEICKALSGNEQYQAAFRS